MSDENQTEQAAEPVKKESIAISFGGGKLMTSVAGLKTPEHPVFGIGDTVKVHYRIKEGDKERVQLYEGTVGSIRGEGPGRTFLVRRISHDIGVERIFPFASPAIAKIEVSRKGKVRRAKLFYLRHKSGKEGRIKELMKEGSPAQTAAAGVKSARAKADKAEKASKAEKSGKGKKRAS